jgi:hypothetical protein
MTKTAWGDSVTKLPLVGSLNATYYPGCMMGRATTGYAQKLDDTAKLTFDGINAESTDIVALSTDSSGDRTMNVDRPWLFTMTIASAAITDVYRPVYALYDNEVSFSPGSYGNLVGRVWRFVDSATVQVAPPWSPLFLGEAESASFVYGEATALDACFHIASKRIQVVGITVRPLVVGSDGGAVTLAVKKVPSGTATASGTALHTGTADLKGTINTNQALTLSSTLSDLRLAAGDSLGIDVTGTMTAARGVVTVDFVSY